ncbi:FMN-linked oxidoreductase [Microstroma glucosiphilum]|uniref:FMN-linked oxidoreductase n=1 Tax=Pseudomicrostroma glucosiphilum TaxID=1684307 RepID=A0A316U5H5_9BASI|nr:FMN-linked oxidoreductase [Pseudomicrostroma glucosiphilum]PWN20450.1 FMN-linked oxidoreductase [Pseudomicrostroma glucosiphilum]
MSPSATTRSSAGLWPQDKPIALANSSFVPTRHGHPAPGTVPDDIVPEGEKKPKLFEQAKLPHSDLVLKNRAVVSPMCQYSARNGVPTPYHLAHLGQFALHGAGTIMVEASGVTSAGRITPQDLGIWSDEQIAAHASLVTSLKSFTEGLTMGVQLAHAGRKASTWSPFYRGDRKSPHYVSDAEGGWEKDTVGPSPIPYGEGWITPRELTTKELQDIIQSFVVAARRAFNECGYDFIEIHSAHGYLLDSLNSPLSNKRTDQYGGSFENRTRALREIISQIKKEFPHKSVWLRIGSTNFAEHVEDPSWGIEDTKRLAQELGEAGEVDVIDCSAGGLVPFQKINPRPGYQVPFAEGVSSLGIAKSKLLVGSVGMLEGPDVHQPGHLAEEVLQKGQADLIFLARGFLANPSWVEDSATQLMGTRCAGNPQYHRVHPAKRPPPRAQNHN